MHPAGHQVVSRALGSGLGQDRRLDLEEPFRVEVPTSRLHQPVAENQIVLELGSAEIEHPVAEPQLLGRELLFLLPGHRNGRRLRRPDHFQASHVHLHLA